MARSAIQKATEAADQLEDWLRGRRGASQDEAGGADEGRPEVGTAASDVTERAGALPSAEGPAVPAAAARDRLDHRPALARSARPTVSGAASAPLRLPHTDWLHHRLAVSGPTGDVAAFRAAAAGAGLIPWQLDLDRLEEDWFHLLVSPPPPQQRTLSLAGARLLAGQLREAVARRHELAVVRVGRSRACPLDLHTLLPVPEVVLQLGPDDPAALAWLWEHWGTTQALLRVAEDAAAARGTRRRPPPDEAGHAHAGEGLPEARGEQAAFHLTFWSADWTPWRALATLAERWPALRFDTHPSYDDP